MQSAQRVNNPQATEDDTLTVVGQTITNEDGQLTLLKIATGCLQNHSKDQQNERFTHHCWSIHLLSMIIESINNAAQDSFYEKTRAFK